MVLLAYRAVFDKKGGFGGGSHRHKQKYKKSNVVFYNIRRIKISH